MWSAVICMWAMFQHGSMQLVQQGTGEQDEGSSQAGFQTMCSRPTTSTAHLVLTDHDSEVLSHEAELLLQRVVRRAQLCKLCLCLLRPLLCSRCLLVELGVLHVE